MQLRLFFILNFIPCLLVGQNLVPNFSFENNIGCPTTQGDLVKAVPWKNVNGQTPDYFHSCGLPLWYSAPDNSSNFGYQDASEGVAYAGIRAWDNDFGPAIREYIGVALNSPLLYCKPYFISFKVSRADGPTTGLATDDIGLYLSNTEIITTTNILSSFTPQVRQSEGNLITDELGWTTVSDVYIAHGGEKFIVIGNFNV